MMTKAFIGTWQTGLLLLLPAAACAELPPQASKAMTGSTPAMSLESFTARRERQMLLADIDGDGKVSSAEFMAPVKSGKGDPTRRFVRLDGNGDGFIDRQEIATVMTRRFKRLDRDGDGNLTATERTLRKATMARDDPES